MSTTTNKPTSSSSNQAAKIQAYIDGKIESTRRQVKSVDLLAGILWMVVFVVAFFLVAAIVDAWIWPLGSLGRWVGLIALIGGIVALLVGTLLPLVSRKINPDFAAKMIEDAKPGFRNSVLNYVALKRNPESIKAAVLDAVSRQAATDLSNIPKDETVDRSKLIQLGIILIGLVAAAMLYGLISPKNPLTTVGRILFPSADLAKPAVVRVTDVAPGDARVFFGDPLLVSARISGVYEAEDVRLIYSTADGQLVDQVLSMEADPTRSGRYQVDLGGETGIRQTLSYQVIAGDGQSAKYEIIVEPKPAITIESIRIEPPKYTGLPTQQQSVGSIEAAEGSQVYITATANLPIDRAYIQMLREVSTDNDVKYVDVGGGQKMRVADQTAEGRFQLVMDADRLQPFATHYRLEFFSTDGNRNEQANIHPIRIIPDLAPEIKIQHPQQSEVSVPVNGSLPVVIEATELDYQLTAVRLIGEFRGRNVLDQSLPLQFQDEGKRHASCSTAIRPQDLGLSAGDQLLFYAIAADNRTSYYSEEEPDPNVSRTGNYILVVTEADPEAEQQTKPDPENSGAEQPRDPAENGFRENQPDESKDANDPGESNQDQSQDPAEDGQPEDQQPGDENQPSQPNDPDGGMKPDQQAGTDPQQESQDPAGQNPDNNQQNNATDPGQQSSGGSDSEGGDQAQPQEGAAGSGQAGSQQSGQPSGQQENAQSGSSGSQSGSQTGGNQDPGGSRSGSQNSSTNNVSSSGNSGRNGETTGSSNNSPAQSGAQNDPGNAQTTRGSGEPGQQQLGEGSSDADGPERRDSNLTEGEREQLPADASDARRMRELQKLMDEGKLDQPSGEQDSTDSKQGNSTDPNRDQAGNPDRASGNPNESDPGSESAAGSDSDAQDGSGKAADDEQGDQSAQGSPTGNDQGQSGESPAGDQQQPGQSGNDSDTGQENQGDETMDPSGQGSDGTSQDSQSGNSERGSDQGSGTEGGDNPSGGESPQSSQGGSDSGSDGDASGTEPEQGAKSQPTETSSDDPSGSEGTTDRPNQNGQPGESQQGSGDSEGDSQSQEGEPGGQSGGNAGQERNSGQGGETGQAGSKNSADSGQSGNGGQPGQEGESGQPGDSGQSSQEGNKGPQGDSAQSGQPGPGGQDGAAQQGADSDSQSGSQSSSGASPSSGSAGASNGSSDSGASQGGGGAMSGSEETPVDQQNLNHAKKATDLVLNRLSEQKNEPDQELLDRLNMNQQDFKKFVERWEQMRDAATKGDPDAQRRYERAIKSIGLRPQGSLRRTARNQDRPEGLSQDGDVLRVRPELRRDFEAFQQDLNRSQR